MEQLINSFGSLQEECEKKQKAILDSEGMMPDDDKVDHPSHYQSYNPKVSIECIDAMRAAFGEVAVAHFCVCNAFKYLWRHPSKGGMIDIDKAIYYLNYYKKINRIDMGE